MDREEFRKRTKRRVGVALIGRERDTPKVARWKRRGDRANPFHGSHVALAAARETRALRPGDHPGTAGRREKIRPTTP